MRRSLFERKISRGRPRGGGRYGASSSCGARSGTDALVGTIPGGVRIAPRSPSRRRYVQSVVPPDERIFVGNARYHSLVLNDVMFYFLAGPRSGTRYHELVPGVATTVEVQARIVQDLERHRVRYGVIRAGPGYVPSPGGGKTLDGFIQEKFARVETFGTYGVWRRRQERS